MQASTKKKTATKTETTTPPLAAVPPAPTTTTPPTVAIARSTLVQAIIPGALDGDENGGAVARLALEYAADELETILRALDDLHADGDDPHPSIDNQLFRLQHRLRAAVEVSRALMPREVDATAV